MYLTPFKLYLLVWLPGLGASAIINNELIKEISGSTVALVLAPALVYAMFGLASRSERIRSAPHQTDSAHSPLQKIVNQIHVAKALSTLRVVGWTWLVLYLVMIVYSDGFPLLWVINGDPRTYVDFGVPTLGGLCNMLRAFAAALGFLMLAHHEVSLARKKRIRMLVVLLLFTAFGLETGRGNGVVLLLHPVAFFFLGRVLKIKTILKLVLITPAFFLSLGYIQHVRYGSDWEQTEGYVVSQGFEVSDSRVRTLFVPAVTYLVSPVQNLNLQIAEAQIFSLSPHHSVLGLFPTIIRNKLFEPRDYGSLLSEANNATSGYAPLIRDFGVLGGSIAAIVISIITGWTWLQATRGRLFFALLWPAFFMTIALSFFSLYFTSLVVVLYVPLAWLVANIIRGAIKG